MSDRKLILAVPTYGPVDPMIQKYLRVAVMHAARNGCVWLGDCSADRQPYAAARNNAVQSVINDDQYADASIVWVDSDVLLPQAAITRLAHYGHDFITGIYFQRAGAHWPLIANYNEESNSFQWLIRWPENAVVAIDGCGFGFVLTSVRMLREMKTPWFEYRKFSEDFDFCLKAKEAGYQLYCDTGVVCGHLADPEPVTDKTYRDQHPEFFADLGDNVKLVTAEGIVDVHTNAA